MHGKSLRRLLNYFIFRGGLTLVVYDIKRVLVHLLDDETNFALTPDMICVADINLRVDIKFTNLTLLLRLYVVLLPL